MEFPTDIRWTSPFPILGLLGCIFHFYSKLNRNFCLQTMEDLIRRLVLRRLIWFCTVCPCPTKRTLGLSGLMFNRVSVRTWLELGKIYTNNDHYCGLLILIHGVPKREVI